MDKFPFQIPRILQQYCRGQSELSLTGTTVGGLLQELRCTYPDLYTCICNETGQIRPHINIFINDDFLRDRNGLDTPLTPGDVLSVFQAVSGG